MSQHALVLSSLLLFSPSLFAQGGSSKQDAPDPVESTDPNPAEEDTPSLSDLLNPNDSAGCDRCPVQITNMRGQVVSYARGRQMTMDDIAQLESGLYIVSIRHKTGRLLSYKIHHRGY